MFENRTYSRQKWTKILTIGIRTGIFKASSIGWSIIHTFEEFLINVSTISNFVAKSALVDSTFLRFVAESLTGKRQGVKTIAKLLESILLWMEFSATCDRNLIRHVREAACNGGNKRQAVKIASLLVSPVNLQHLKWKTRKLQIVKTDTRTRFSAGHPM